MSEISSDIKIIEVIPAHEIELKRKNTIFS